MFRLDKTYCKGHKHENAEKDPDHIESGPAEPNISKLEKISEALDTDPCTLLGTGNTNYFNHEGTHYVGGSNNGPVTFQFDKVVLEGLLSKMSGYEKEIAELKAKLEKLG